MKVEPKSLLVLYGRGFRAGKVFGKTFAMWTGPLEKSLPQSAYVCLRLPTSAQVYSSHIPLIFLSDSGADVCQGLRKYIHMANCLHFSNLCECAGSSPQQLRQAMAPLNNPSVGRITIGLKERESPFYPFG